MRKQWIGALLCVLLVMLGCGPSEWVEFESDEGEFAVLMPRKPKVQRQKVPTAVGQIEVVIYMHDAGSKAYMVAFSDYPESLIQQKDPERMLSDGVKGAMRNIRGSKNYEKDITLGGYKGKEITFTVPSSSKLRSGGKGKARMFLVKNRLYQVLALGLKSISEVEFDKFLDSFELYE